MNSIDKFKVKVVMVKGEKGEAGNSGDYSGLTNKPKINGVTLEGNQSSTDLNLIGEQELNMVNSRIDEIIAGYTTGATGVVISESVVNGTVETESGVSYLTASFQSPGYILEAAYREGDDDPLNPNPWKTDGVEIVQVMGGINVRIPGVSAPALIRLVSAQYQPVTQTELEDIRVGYDGTVYGTAGTAVRSQIRQAMAGFKATVQQALLECFEHVAWVDDQGQTYYDALQAALLGQEVASISAVFDQGENVIYDTDSLDELKQYLTVTANYDDGTSGVVTWYTLSGTLTDGTSTITVSYGGKTATFTVNVVALPDTSPVITDTGKYLNQNGELVNNSSWCVTDFYGTKFVSLPYTLVVGFGASYGTGGPCLITYDSDKVKTNQYSCTTQEREMAWKTVEPYPYFRTSLYGDGSDGYAYIKETGEVIFAGANTPYYGKANIND